MYIPKLMHKQASLPFLTWISLLSGRRLSLVPAFLVFFPVFIRQNITMTITVNSTISAVTVTAGATITQSNELVPALLPAGGGMALGVWVGNGVGVEAWAGTPIKLGDMSRCTSTVASCILSKTWVTNWKGPVSGTSLAHLVEGTPNWYCPPCVLQGGRPP